MTHGFDYIFHLNDCTIYLDMKIVPYKYGLQTPDPNQLPSSYKINALTQPGLI